MKAKGRDGIRPCIRQFLSAFDFLKHFRKILCCFVLPSSCSKNRAGPSASEGRKEGNVYLTTYSTHFILRLYGKGPLR